MKNVLKIFGISTGFLLVMTILCGIIYTSLVTVFGQLLFPEEANGSIIEENGNHVASELLGQNYTDERYLWGRIMNVNTSLFFDEAGNPLMYSFPTNLSVESEQLSAIVKERIAYLEKAHPDMKEVPIPVDLVTSSGSGLDPEISVAAAHYQIQRLALANGVSSAEIEEIIDQCTNHKLFGILGEETVNVVKVNLMLKDIMK